MQLLPDIVDSNDINVVINVGLLLVRRSLSA